jgi:hypothetical protein
LLNANTPKRDPFEVAREQAEQQREIDRSKKDEVVTVENNQGSVSATTLTEEEKEYRRDFNAPLERAHQAGKKAAEIGESVTEILTPVPGVGAALGVTKGFGKGLLKIIKRESPVRGSVVESNVANKTGTVWDSIKVTQEAYPGTVIPRSFEMTAGESRVWVHGNSTEHMAEYAQSMLNRGVGSDLVNVSSQTQLRSLQAAVESATTNGVPYNRLLNTGGWELKFAPPRAADQLPVLIHALPVR